MEIKYVNLGLLCVETDDGRSGMITNMFDEFGDDTDVPDNAVSCIAEVAGHWFAVDLREYDPALLQ